MHKKNAEYYLQHGKSGKAENVDILIAALNEKVDLPTTKVIDYSLSLVNTKEGRARIEYHLFNGTQMQRNYCTLFFNRQNEWAVVNKAYNAGLIDFIQAYSR